MTVSTQRKSWIAAVMSFFAIGLGHLYAGRPMRGAVFLLVWLCIWVVAVSLLLLPLGIFSVLLMLATVLGFFILTVFDAARSARKSPFHYGRTRYNRWYVYVVYWIAVSLVIQPGIQTLMKRHVVRAFIVPTAAMEPTLLPGDYLIVDKTAYRNAPPVRGDVVIVRPAEDPGRDAVLRVVGIGGDTVEIRDSRVLIDGRPLVDPGAGPEGARAPPAGETPRTDLPPTRVPENAVFLLGDNRDTGAESRLAGPVAVDRIDGQARYLFFSRDETRRKVRWDRVGRQIE